MAAALQKTLNTLLSVGSANHKELIEKLRGVLEQIISLKDEERITGNLSDLFISSAFRPKLSVSSSSPLKEVEILPPLSSRSTCICGFYGKRKRKPGRISSAIYRLRGAHSEPRG